MEHKRTVEIEDQIATERLWLKGLRNNDTKALRQALHVAGHNADSNPYDASRQLAYADAVIAAREGTHYIRAIQALERCPAHGCADIKMARLYQLLGRTSEAIELLAEQPRGPRSSISPQAYAAWLACQAREPHLAEAPACENAAAAAVAVIRAWHLDDDDAGRAAVGALLDHVAATASLSEPVAIGMDAVAGNTITPIEWICEACEKWGSRLAWLAPHRREELGALLDRVGIRKVRPEMQDRLIEKLAAGDAGAAAGAFADLVEWAQRCRTALPLDWRATPLGQPIFNVEQAFRTCEARIVTPKTLTPEAVIVWYDHVLRQLLERHAEPAYRLVICRQVVVLTGSARARIDCAQVLAEMGRQDAAREMAWPLQTHVSYGDTARQFCATPPLGAKWKANTTEAVG